MSEDLIAKFDRSVPRYTSYPTAAEFHRGIDAAVFRGWLESSARQSPLSLYIHVPYCRQMCWYCGCHTKITRQQEPVDQFVATLHAEIDLVAACLSSGGSAKRSVSHLHWGGGTPNILSPDQFRGVYAHLADVFSLAGLEHAIEIDPRQLQDGWYDAMLATDVKRVSLGVQDFDPEVQQAINRIQPARLVAVALGRLRAAGIDGVNFDLLYGLPRQSLASLRETLRLTMDMRPDRISLFGYAHIPWLKPHQRLINPSEMPDAAQRWEMREAAEERLMAGGYRAVGIDHYALATDSLARAAEGGALKRNFQGYTTDTAATMIGLGPSAISSCAAGYAQNAPVIHAWQKAIAAGQLATGRGIAVDRGDLFRRAIISDLMCNGEVDLDAIAATFSDVADDLAEPLRQLQPFLQNGIATIDRHKLIVLPSGRPLLRVIAACFDAYRPVASDLAQAPAEQSPKFSRLV